MKTNFANIIDWIWPRLNGSPIPPPTDQFTINSNDGELLDEIGNTVEKRTDQIEERSRVVETKLVALLTLTSVLSAAVTAGFAAASTISIQKGFPLVPVWLTLFLVFYIALQLLRSLWATVNGLVRRNYKQIKCEDLLPEEKEDKTQYKIRILAQKLNYIKWNDWVVNEKVNQMAIAHTGLRNALFATGGVIILALITAIINLT